MFKRAMDSRFIKLVKRFVPLMLSIWMLIDIILDANQTATYYWHSFENGTYKIWALGYGIRNETGVDHIHQVSPWYLYVASAIWITPPFLLSGLSLFGEFRPLRFTYSMLEDDFNINLPEFPSGKVFNTFATLILFPVDMLFSSVFIYIVIPAASLKSSLIIAWKGSIDEETNLVGVIDTSDLPVWKLFEHIGEALPQIILAVVFSSNNFPFLVAKDIIIPYVPTTLISIIFSCGSLCMGMYTGIKSCLEEINDDDD